MICQKVEADGPAAPVPDDSPDGAFRYDSKLGGSGGYVFDLETAGLAPGRYCLRFTIGDDPQSHSMTFEVR